MSRPPNILWFCTDQQRFDTIRALNNPHINTPNLDRLVGEGVAFTHAYCQNQICTPSRTSFLTGMYPSSIRACICGNEEYSGAAPLVTRLLAEAGYVCGLSGKLHIASPWLGAEKRVEDGYSFFRYSHSPFSRLDQGNDYMQWLLGQGIDPASIFERKPPGKDTEFGEYLPSVKPEIHQTTWCTDEAIRFVTENRDRPWLISVNVLDPHSPFDPPDEYRRRYDVDDLPDPHFQEGDLEIQARLEGVDFPHNASPPKRSTPRARWPPTTPWWNSLTTTSAACSTISKKADSAKTLSSFSLATTAKCWATMASSAKGADSTKGSFVCP